MVFKVNLSQDSVRDVDCISSEVSHIFRELIPYEVDVRLQVFNFSRFCLVSFEVWVVDVNNASLSPDIFWEAVILE